MNTYMDVHTVSGGVDLDDVTKAHQADPATQGEFHVNYLRYWVDEAHGKIFCLVADEIYQVNEGA
ncbi:nickel-binding protein [Actinoplanes sp. NPDC049596]|uniref:nickel-binding protein n=1 Tax=unclassified Actinoplanes TaxID=2626549 RepID=UPI0034387AD6